MQQMWRRVVLVEHNAKAVGNEEKQRSRGTRERHLPLLEE